MPIAAWPGTGHSYAITDSGRLELAALRDRLLHEISFGSDPFDVALWVSAELPVEELASAIDRRCASLQERRDRLEHERTRLTTAGYLPVVGQLLFRHGEIRIAGELEWHQELRRRLSEHQTPNRASEAKSTGPSPPPQR